MTADAKPSLFGSAITAWRDAFGALGSMLAVTGIALLLLVVLRIANGLVPPADVASGLTRPLAQLAFAIIQAFLITPLAIAVHRHVLLGEVTKGYSLDPSQPRFLRFFGFAALLHVLWAIATNLPMPGGPEQSASEQWTWDQWASYGLNVAYSVVSIVIVIAVVIALVRAVFLFPAVAVDAPGAGWRNAMRDAKGHFWRTLVILFLTVLPAPAILIALALLATRLVFFGAVTFAIVITAMYIVTFAALAAAASRLYRAFANDLGQPAGSGAAAAPA